jgi:hypothetical protein
LDDLLLIISGLGGALIGAAASIVTTWVQAKVQNKRERLSFITNLALQDYKLSIELADKSGRSYSSPPVAVFLHYHIGLNKLIESEKFSEENYKKLVQENQAFIKTAKNLQQK